MIGTPFTYRPCGKYMRHTTPGRTGVIIARGHIDEIVRVRWHDGGNDSAFLADLALAMPVEEDMAPPPPPFEAPPPPPVRKKARAW